jgi:predicted CXXCH cytochrome family protein
MRKFLILSLGLLLAGGVSQAAVVGSVHDFSTGSTGVNATTEDQVCKFCHAPHNNITGLSSAPLWNHSVSTVSTYGTYASDTFNGVTTIADVAAATDNNSWLCMSCHDGTVAIGALAGGQSVAMNATDLDGDGTIAGTRDMGTDLTNDHPVNFDAVAAEAEDPDISLDPAFPLFADIMHCGTCHDPHDSFAFPMLLRENTADSEICTDCHDK